MKKVNYFFVLLCVACVFGSCAVGSYVPSTLNVGGISTQVVLSQANYRVVRNIETVVDINNDNLRRADVEKSAFAELMRKYPLTGSQAYINVVLEEVRREKFGMAGALQKRKQHVAVRATIIEFLQENGEPIKSVALPYNTALQREVKSEPQKSENKQVQVVEPPKETLYESKPLSNKEVSAEGKQQVQFAPNIEALTSKYSEKHKDSNRADVYYIALLMKTGQFNESKMHELELIFDVKDINIYKNDLTVKYLQKHCKGHDQNLEVFKK